jgi:hypothetical protein
MGRDGSEALSSVPRRSTRFIFLRHLKGQNEHMHIHDNRERKNTNRSQHVPGPSGPGPHFSTHFPSLYLPACPH